MEKTILSPSAPQFSRLEYSLQLSLNASTARITHAYIVSNPSWTMSFEKRTQDIMTVDCWIDSADLYQNCQSVDETVKRLSASQFPTNTGVKVRVGHLSLADIANAKITKTLVYCRVGLGRAYVVDGRKQVVSEQLPIGYDSYHLHSENDVKDGSHLYLIKSQNQLLPLFVATFEFDPMEEKRSRERPVCDNCEKKVADVFCAADSAYLCRDCDVNLHTSKISQRHQRTQLGRGPDAFGNCRIHEQNIEFFCSTCHVPVCIHCKMIGHHSSGEASKHKLVKVIDAFDVVLQESGKKQSAFDNRYSEIQKQMTLIQQRRQQVGSMQVSLEHQLKQIYQKALEDLHKAVDRKRIILLGDELELIRQKDELQQLEGFLEYQRTAVDMYHLLFNWSTHQAMRQSLSEFAFFRDSIDVALDLKVDGGLKVCEDGNITGAAASAGGLVGSSTAVSSQKNCRNHVTLKKTGVTNTSVTVDLGKLQLKRTSDLFAEALTGSDGLIHHHERSSAVNKYDMDERSATATGYEDDYC